MLHPSPKNKVWITSSLIFFLGLFWWQWPEPRKPRKPIQPTIPRIPKEAAPAPRLQKPTSSTTSKPQPESWILQKWRDLEDKALLSQTESSSRRNYLEDETFREQAFETLAHPLETETNTTRRMDSLDFLLAAWEVTQEDHLLEQLKEFLMTPIQQGSLAFEQSQAGDRYEIYRALRKHYSRDQILSSLEQIPPHLQRLYEHVP